MDNQHKKIKGYRDLSQEEVDLMNRIKAHGEKTGELVNELLALRNRQWGSLSGDEKDSCGLTNEQISESRRAILLAKSELQTGQMWLVRAVALPDSF